MKTKFNEAQIHELLFQAIETERGGIQVYTTAIQCAVNEDLREEWSEYLEETRTHERVLTSVFEQLGLDTETPSPGRAVCAHLGKSLVKAMLIAQENGDTAAAQLVAAECVVMAEVKDHANWELIGHVSDNTSGDMATVLKQAYEAVEKDEDHHLYHTQGWARELWIESLGFPAVLPPPEEVKKVETAIGASRAEQQRDSML